MKRGIKPDLDDGQGVALNRKCKSGICGRVDDAEPVALASHDVNARACDRWTSNITPNAIDGSTVRDLRASEMRIV